jgi:hypothetical protein
MADAMLAGSDGKNPPPTATRPTGHVASDAPFPLAAVGEMTTVAAAIPVGP